MTAKFEQIKKYILEKIESGEWQENALVPSENKLADDFAVSRMTARRAVEELSQQGILNRTKGSGTYVASLKGQGSMFEIKDIADEITARGHQHKATVIELETIKGALDKTQGNKTDAADLLGIHRTLLYKKMKKLGLDVKG